jgi:tripartite-type tricarboxylate transporter receptor subunit TctC
MIVRGVLACLLAVAFAVGPAAAQSWPTKTIEWIVPFAPGGSTDTVARIVADKLKDRLGVAVVVVNRPGANADIGYRAAAGAAPDGHTIVLTVPSLVTNAYYLKGSLDPARLAPVIYLAEGPYLLLGSAKLGAKTVAEAVQAIRARPGAVSCALTGGVGSIGCEMLQAHAKADLLKVPFRGVEQATLALMSGEIDLVFNFAITARAAVESGRVTGLATTSHKRGSLPFREMPTMAETLPGFTLAGWDGVAVPLGTPPDIVARMNRELNAVLALPDVRKRLEEGGLEPVGGSPQDFAQRLDAVQASFGKVLKDAGVTPQ